METIVVIALLVALLWWIAWEDTRYRAVSVWTFPVLFAALFASRAYATSWSITLESVTVNFAIISIQLLGIWLYLIAKHRAFVNPMRGFIGWGDVLFWIAVLPAFSPINFLLFCIISLSVALLAHVCFRKAHLYGDATRVPLAGLQAIVYSGWLLTYGFSDSPSIAYL